MRFAIFFGIVVLPCVLMAMGIFHAIRGAYRADSRARSTFLYPLICAVIMTGGFTTWALYAIYTSRSSTAGIGLLLLPVCSLVVGAYGFLVTRLVIQRTKNGRHSEENGGQCKKE